MSRKKPKSQSDSPSANSRPTPEQFREAAVELGIMNLDLDPEPAILDRLAEVIEQLPERAAEQVYQSILAESRKSEPDAGEFLRKNRISKAEARLLESLAQGATVVEHAEKMGVSINTARTHMRRLLEKTGAKGQLDLVRKYRK